MTATPALALLNGAYLNEDWPADYETWQDAVDDFITGSPQEADRLPDEVTKFLAEYPDEDEVKRQLIAQGFAYLPTHEEGGYRAILGMIANRVESATRGRARNST